MLISLESIITYLVNPLLSCLRSKSDFFKMISPEHLHSFISVCIASDFVKIYSILTGWVIVGSQGLGKAAAH